MKQKTIFLLSICITIIFLTGCGKNSNLEHPNKNTHNIKNTDQEQFEAFEEEMFLAEFDEELNNNKKTDYLEIYNRAITSFNDLFYVYVLSPTAQGYKAITHKEVRRSISNFFSNIYFPISLVNNIFQGELVDASTELRRFLINTTLGFAGLFDPALEQFGLKRNQEDFGQTLGVWGFGSGPHIVLPFLGPSNLRDIAGKIPDTLLNPIDYYENRGYNLVDNSAEATPVTIFKVVNTTALNKKHLDEMRREAIDLYPYYKSMYEQYRTNQIKD